ncbi:MAG: DUF7010 family protein [Planctomycetota bacterium]|jgi:hypothetical protein
MLIEDAQKEVRRVFIGGFVGQMVSGILWLTSACLATWSSPRSAITFLVVGGMFIFPLTQLCLRLMGRQHALSKGNPLNGLGMQIAFTLPLTLPVVGAAALYRLEWFYPAFMIVLGAHYLPFTFLYGMRMYIPLAGLLIASGVALGMYLPNPFPAGAWVTSLQLMVFALIARALSAAEARNPSQ